MANYILLARKIKLMAGVVLVNFFNNFFETINQLIDGFLFLSWIIKS